MIKEKKIRASAGIGKVIGCIEGKDISRLFASLGSDKSLVGREKTMYFQQLHKVLRNPDAFPDEVMDIQKQLGLDVGIGFRNGGLAGILEV